MNGLSTLVNAPLERLASLGRSLIFLLRVLLAQFSLIRRPRLVVQQLYSVGNLSLLIIVVSGIFVGMVLGLSGYRLLVRFGAEQALGVSVAYTVIRELGPVVTALLFAGRAGSALAAELGLMRATDQLTAMEMMAIDPIRHVVAPRMLAGVLSLPLLTAIFSVMAIGAAGGHYVGVTMLGVDNGAYWSQIQAGLSFDTDILAMFLKSFVFGILITWVALYQGFHAEPTSEGVSRATTSTVVIASLAILGANLLLTAVLFGGN